MPVSINLLAIKTGNTLNILSRPYVKTNAVKANILPYNLATSGGAVNSLAVNITSPNKANILPKGSN